MKWSIRGKKKILMVNQVHLANKIIKANVHERRLCEPLLTLHHWQDWIPIHFGPMIRHVWHMKDYEEILAYAIYSKTSPGVLVWIYHFLISPSIPSNPGLQKCLPLCQRGWSKSYLLKIVHIKLEIQKWAKGTNSLVLNLLIHSDL